MPVSDKRIFTLTSDSQRAECSKYLFTIQPDKKLPYKVVVTPGSETRTDRQRRLQFLWYRERAKQFGNTPKYEQRYCKLVFGIPILRCDDDEFNDFYAGTIDHLEYNRQLVAMDFVEVTRHFSVKQNVEYLNDIENDSIENGCTLTHPEDLYWESLMKNIPARK